MKSSASLCWFSDINSVVIDILQGGLDNTKL